MKKQIKELFHIIVYGGFGFALDTLHEDGADHLPQKEGQSPAIHEA
jgi:hypothetical protein